MCLNLIVEKNGCVRDSPWLMIRNVGCKRYGCPRCNGGNVENEEKTNHLRCKTESAGWYPNAIEYTQSGRHTLECGIFMRFEI